MKDKILLRMFREYNRAYFDNLIEEPDVIEYRAMRGKAGLSQWCSQEKTKLFIHKDLKSFVRLTQIVLIHEMSHLHLGPDYRPHHGMRFDAMLDKLYMQGAYEGLL